MEAAAWRVNATTLLAVEAFSNFGWVWQNSGTTFAGGNISFPIFSSATPHTVSGLFQYYLAFGMKSTTGGALYALGFRVNYTVP